MTAAKFIPPKSQISQLFCKKCPLSTCAGCGGNPTFSKNMTFTPLGVVDHCCHGGRLFGIWLLLSIFDEDELKQKKTSISVRKPESQPKGPKKAAVPSGVGYGGAGYGGAYGEYSPGGYGVAWDEIDYDSEDMDAIMMHQEELMMLEGPIHGAGYPLGRSALASSSLKDAEEEESPDVWMTSTLTLLTAFLTSSTPDYSEQELLLFRLSFLFDRVTALMRNDSISEVTQRRDLYDSAFSFVQVITDNSTLVQLIFESRLDKKDSPGLRYLSDGLRKGSINFNTSTADLSASLFSCSNNTYRQAQVFLKLARKSEQASSKKASIRLCTSIVGLYGQMEQRAAIPDRYNIENIRDPWTKYAEENRVTFTDDVLNNHHYLPAIVGTNSINLQRGRLNIIGREIANMTTSLPVGIFLKVAESRTDTMKALMVGAEGSPYAGGLFM